MRERKPSFTSLIHIFVYHGLTRNNIGIEINKQTVVDNIYRMFHNNKQSSIFLAQELTHASILSWGRLFKVAGAYQTPFK